MARTTRKVLDLALVSLEKIRPAVAKTWDAAKSFIIKSPAKPLVCNTVVCKIEDSLERLTGSLSLKLRSLRDRQLPREVEYLEKELDKVKKLCADKDKRESAAKSVKWFGATSWKYLKVEAVPPFTFNFFNGSAGRKFERFAGNMADGFIEALSSRIKEIDDEAERERMELAAAIKAYEDKRKAEARRKEAERIKAEALRAAEAAEKAQAKALAEKISDQTKAEKDKSKEKLKKKKRKAKRRPKKPKKED